MTVDSPLQAVELLPSEPVVQSNGAVYRRASKYGEQYVNVLNLDRLADEGSLFRLRNPTQYTGVAQTANTTQDTTKPFLFGSNPSTSKKSVRLLRLRLRATAVSSGQTVQNIDVITAIGGSRASAGTDNKIQVTGLNATIGYNNVGRADVSQASVMDALWAGAPVTVLGTNAQLAASMQGRTTTIPVIGDEYIINFGSLFSGSAGNGVTPVGTTVDSFVKQEPACIIPPGCTFMVIPWAVGIGGAMSWEYELIWTER